MAGNPNGRLRRNLTVWQAVGLSVALMAPSMAANINPQFTAQTVGRAVPLAFLFAAIGVLLVAYGVRTSLPVLPALRFGLRLRRFDPRPANAAS